MTAWRHQSFPLSAARAPGQTRAHNTEKQVRNRKYRSNRIINHVELIRQLLCVLHRYAALLSRCQKLIPRLPGWQVRLICNIETESEAEGCHLLHACKIPVLLILVGRLMIMLCIIFLENGFPKVRRLADVTGPLRDRKGGNSGSRERKVIGAVIMSLAGHPAGREARAWFAQHR